MCNFITLPTTSFKPYMSPRDMELLLGGITRLLKKYADNHQIEELIASLQDILSSQAECHDKPSIQTLILET